MKIIKFENKYRDDMIFMVLEAKNALDRVQVMSGMNQERFIKITATQSMSLIK